MLSFAHILPRSGKRPHIHIHFKQFSTIFLKTDISLSFFLSIFLLFKNRQVFPWAENNIRLYIFTILPKLAISSFSFSLSLFLPRLLIFKSFFLKLKNNTRPIISQFFQKLVTLSLSLFHSWQPSGPFSLSYEGLLYHDRSKAGKTPLSPSLPKLKIFRSFFRLKIYWAYFTILPKLAISRSFLKLKQYKAYFTILPKPATLFLLSSLFQSWKFSLSLSLPKLTIFRPFPWAKATQELFGDPSKAEAMKKR